MLKTGVMFSSSAISVFVYNLSKCILLFFSYIAVAVILLVSLALMVQFSLPYNKAGRAVIVLYCIVYIVLSLKFSMV